jgi:mono/diheme cytochrome c family protein
VSRQQGISLGGVAIILAVIAGLFVLSRMRIAVPPQGTLSSPEYGAVVFQRFGCDSCHTVDGRAGIGPTLRNVYGYQRTLIDRRVVLADEEYLARSILDHGADVVLGYGNVGPSFAGQMDQDRVDVLVEFLKSLSDRGEPTKQDEIASQEPDPS